MATLTRDGSFALLRSDGILRMTVDPENRLGTGSLAALPCRIEIPIETTTTNAAGIAHASTPRRALVIR